MTAEPPRTGIVSLTPAAAIDHTYLLSELVPGEVNRAFATHTELSGKGVNVAQAVALAEHPVCAVLALGERDRAIVERSVSREFLRPVYVPGHTRINTTIVDSHGHTTKVNEAPVPLSHDSWSALRSTVEEETERLDAGWLVLCGSIPTLEGSVELVPFSDLLRETRARDIRIAIDTSGAALDRALANLERIDLLKPNTHELAALTRRDLATIGDVVEAAQWLRQRGVGVVYSSLGEDGSLVVADAGVWWARAQASTIANSAGAGDASLAGFLVGLGSGLSSGLDSDAGSDTTPESLVRALSTAASWGALSVSQKTTTLTSLSAVPEAVVMRDPDPETRLRDPARSEREARDHDALA